MQIIFKKHIQIIGIRALELQFEIHLQIKELW
jgi:hypothetical protein